MSTVRGIEAIKLYLPPAQSKIETNIKEEKGHVETTETAEQDDAMTSVERYRQEWTQLLRDLDENPERKSELAFSGELKVSKFRSVFWALLLRVLNADHRSWHLQREQQRKRYEKLQQDFVKNPHDEAETSTSTTEAFDDPLSQSTQSVWNQYFSDQELFGVIRQDVVRTFPGVDFFRKAIIQNAMSNILFYYAREHPYMCYRQGMHEILAPILFVMFSDHQSLLHFAEISKTDIDETLLDVLNPAYLEADSYSLFSRLMSSIESYYRISNLAQTQGGYFASEADNSNAVSSEVEVIGQLNSIRDKILAKEDLHLHNYLLKLDIPLHIFGIRWLRLLFGREFPLLDLLVLWDAIFADSDRFDLPNYILVAMLIRIRDKLLLSDYTTCLTFLMRYPTNVDITLILRHALHMQMPKKFDRPPNAFVYFTMSPPAPHAVANGASSSNQKSRSSASSVAARKQPLAAISPRLVQTVAHPLQQQRARSSSLGGGRGGGDGDDAAKVERQITMLQTRNAADSAALDRLKIGTETARVVMDGYAENSPELMRLELKNAQTVITIARNKLQAYLATVRKHVTKPPPQQLQLQSHKSSSTAAAEEMIQALDGIEELCSFLDVKFMFPLHARSHTAPIDQAQEANEQQRKAKTPSPPHNESNTKPMADKSTTGGDTPLSSGSGGGSTVYEKPDNGFRFNTARMLGHLREIELIPIASDEKIVETHSSSQMLVASAGLGGSDGFPILDPCQYHE